jgi:ABC-type lipoprotein export system ATPase subunit
MPTADIVIETNVSTSLRARQVASIFDVPVQQKQRLSFHVEARFEERAWSIGAIVGPSGSGKSTLARHLFGADALSGIEWRHASVIDDFSPALSVEQIAATCGAVGFNTIPAWLRPYEALSTGEKFRACMARALLESPRDHPIVIDEFTSVVDRQVAKIVSHAIQKYVRKSALQFVAVSCHDDLLDWLQPDWVIDMAAQSFAWRLLQRRPSIDVVISPVAYSAWSLFAPYHYMSAELHRAARCFGLFVDDKIVAFAGVLTRPTGKPGRSIMGISRVVTLPDYQGLGLAFVLMDTIGGIYRALGRLLHMYPSHPPFIRAMDRSPNWQLRKRPGRFTTIGRNGMGGRASAVFRYVGPAVDADAAHRVMRYWESRSNVRRTMSSAGSAAS